MTKVTVALALSLGALLAAPAGAKGSKEPYDPYKPICKDLQDPRSRLTKMRICMTANDWAEQRRIEQQHLRQSQYNGAK